MSRKRHKPEEIVSKLRQVDVLTAQGTPVADPVRSIDGHRGRIRDELLNGEIFYSLREAQIVIESWRRHYNKRPHASLGYRPPRAGRVRARHGGLAQQGSPSGAKADVLPILGPLPEDWTVWNESFVSVQGCTAPRSTYHYRSRRPEQVVLRKRIRELISRRTFRLFRAEAAEHWKFATAEV